MTIIVVFDIYRQFKRLMSPSNILKWPHLIGYEYRLLLKLSGDLEECEIDIGVAKCDEYESQEGRHPAMGHSRPHAEMS